MKRALLVIDMLNDFLEKDGALCIGDSKKIIQNVSLKIREYRSNGNPIIYIMDRHLPQDAEI
jgi:nicotinamidase-related amidase